MKEKRALGKNFFTFIMQTNVFYETKTKLLQKSTNESIFQNIKEEIEIANDAIFNLLFLLHTVLHNSIKIEEKKLAHFFTTQNICTQISYVEILSHGTAGI